MYFALETFQTAFSTIKDINKYEMCLHIIIIQEDKNTSS